jgi:GNAT superfamily N-acetyltransferase
MEDMLTVCGVEYRLVRLLGHGKGGYSYLAEADGKQVVLKQIHHEPCDYYHFGNKIEAECRDYKRLLDAGIRIPKMIAVDTEAERIVKEYLAGDTIFDYVRDGRSVQPYLAQVREMAALAKAAGLNIDYFPTNFVVQDGVIWYVDYECNEYMEEWNFENWGIKYWSRTDAFEDYLKAHADGPKRNDPLLYRAARKGIFGKRMEFGKGSITDALFVYLDGDPEPDTIHEVDAHYRNRPVVCLTEAWKEQIEAQYPDAAVYRRFMMKPANRFTLPELPDLPEGYRLAGMDEAAFETHPFSHGENYASWDAFRAEGSGAVVYCDDRIVASASSFLSLDGEVEMDLSTEEAHRGKGLAAACAARMLRDCMERGITVHWDAQNDISRHMAEKFGFEIETEYPVYWLPDSK